MSVSLVPSAGRRATAAALLAAASLAVAAHSLARLGRAGRRRHRLGPRDPAATASVSVVVPARDEATRVQGCLAALFAQDVEPAEVVVVDDGSRDATAAVARQAGARVVAAPPLPSRVAGKAAACATGSAAALAGEWLAFVDADVHLAPEALSRLLAAADRSGAAATSALARPVAGSWWEQLLVPDLGLQVAERLDLDAIADPARPDAFLSGQCLLVRRDAYDAAGGFAAVAGCLVEDVALARRLKAGGHGLAVWLAPQLVAVRMYERPGDLWEGLAKNLAEVWGSSAAAVSRQAGSAILGAVPWAVLAVPRLRPPPWWPRALLLAAGLLHVVVRAGGRYRAGAEVRWAVAYPAADLVLLAIYLDSVRRRRVGGTVSWKGRTYPADA
ncbi:MAG TPA: glycosyltransferase family 2 protein [Actinomycetota bacterium]|nr:glycosyltransferase family 2 protein [Actinomycetota bacterium]